MASILMLYSTVDGHTREIAERMRQVWSEGGHAVTLASLDAAPLPAPADFDRVVIGASIRYGKHRPNVGDFINAQLDTLRARPWAFFSVSLVARKPNRDSAETNPYLKRFLRTLREPPPLLAVFAGKLEYPRYRFLDRQMIRLIMWMTKGPTNPDAVVDYTDWARVEAFARAVVTAER